MDRNIQTEERVAAKLRNELFVHENVRTQLQNDVSILIVSVSCAKPVKFIQI